jgi:hypothetical protein
VQVRHGESIASRTGPESWHLEPADRVVYSRVHEVFQDHSRRTNSPSCVGAHLHDGPPALDRLAATC